MIKKLSQLLLVLFLALPTLAWAQEAVTLSVSPTLFDMVAEPGQAWRSSVRVVNVNKFDLTVYADVVNFAPRGEGGDGQFIPINQADLTGATLAEWFTISREPVVIPPEQTNEIPFTVMVPADASPGGHFAAILIGTKPLESTGEQTRIQTAQMVTTLFFARVAGDITESGTIREFTTEKTFLNSPEASFVLRFENKGNVHLQPQGEIKIYNMWGEERGVIPINQYSNYGNVLPQSIRRFTFTWKGEWSFSDIGRYTAVATLGYGTKDKQFASAQTVFWVIPIKIILVIVFTLVLFFGTLTWLIRLYVKHMLVMAGIDIDDYYAVKQRSRTVKTRVAVVADKPKLHAPLQAGILDLSGRLRDTVSLAHRLRVTLHFMYQYRLFFLGLALVIGFIAMVVSYISSANTKYRAYEVVYENSGGETAMNSEEILYEQYKNDRQVEAIEPNLELPPLAIVNRSGVPGLGAEARLIVEKLGYRVESLKADFSQPQSRTVIVAQSDYQSSVLPLSSALSSAMVSVAEEADGAEPVTIYVGSNLGAP